MSKFSAIILVEDGDGWVHTLIIVNGEIVKHETDVYYYDSWR